VCRVYIVRIPHQREASVEVYESVSEAMCLLCDGIAWLKDFSLDYGGLSRDEINEVSDIAWLQKYARYDMSYGSVSIGREEALKEVEHLLQGQSYGHGGSLDAGYRLKAILEKEENEEDEEE